MEKAAIAEQNRKIKQNPFVTSDAALGEDFFGREKEIGEIKIFLNKKKERNLLVYGQRRIGKTSLLLKIKEIVNKTGIGKAVFFDLQNKAKYELSQLLFEIAVQICADVEADIKFSKNNFVDEDAASYFRDTFLPQVLEILPGDCRLVLLFDEFDTLGELEGVKGDPKVTNIAYHRFIPYLDGLRNKDFPVKFIFAVGRNYKDLDENRFGQVIKAGSKIEISYFEKEELENLLEGSRDILPFDQDAVNRLYEFTSGHPFFSQCLASAAFDEAVNSGQPTISAQIIEKQFESAIKSYGGGVQWLWKSFSANDMIVLYLMAIIKENHKPISDRNIRTEAGRQNLLPAVQALDKVLEKLINIRIIKRSKAEHLHYDFYVEFFRKWIVMEFSIEEIGMLLSDIDPQISLYLYNARFYYNQGNYPEAINNFEKILEKYPSHYEALYQLGLIHKNSPGKDNRNIDKALKYWQQAYQLNPFGTKDEYLYILNEKLSCLEKEGKDVENIVKEIQRVNPSVKRDIAIIKKIEDIIGKKLQQLPIKDIMRFYNGYSCDEAGNVIGLNLTGLKISDISFVTDFLRLTHLRLSGNQVAALSPLKALTQLTHLDLGYNQITALSPLQALTQLTYLDLGYNQISDLSPLQALTQLTELNLGYNQITDFSPLKALTNKIEIKWEYDSKGGIFVKGNPMGIPPVEIVKQGKKAVAAYFASLEKEERSPLNDVKVTQIQAVKQETNIAIDIKIDLPALKSDFFKLKDELAELAKKDPALAEELRNITDSLDELSLETEKKELTKPLNKMGRLLEKLGDEDSRLSKMLKGTQKGVDLAQKLGRTYNKFAQWLALPQVPDILLGKK